jgi:hypothetical protein
MNSRRLKKVSFLAVLLTLLVFCPKHALGSGHCTADFQVVETSLDPAIGAEVRAKVSTSGRGSKQVVVKHTNENGEARFEKLSPSKSPQLQFTISMGSRSNLVAVDLRKQCHGTYRVILPDKVPARLEDR